jgi:glycosyltransferase involved in cell wall biosynthesis
MKISVIISIYNEEDVVRRCLGSLDTQEYEDFEVIVVDDGSTDDTKKIIKNFKGKYRLRMYSQKHKGPGAARNLGAKHAKGEILVFVDADMTFDKDFLAKLIKPIREGKAKGTFSKEEYVSNWGNIWGRCLNINEGWPAKRRHKINKKGYIREAYDFFAYAIPNLDFSIKRYQKNQKQLSRNVFRAILKDEFDKVGGFTPGGYSDDWSLANKLKYEAMLARGAKFYHENPSSLSEVYQHAKWVGKRRYKMGYLGYVFALLRSSFPISIIMGVLKSVKFYTPQFIIFKIVYDFGVFIGILKYFLSGTGSK